MTSEQTIALEKEFVLQTYKRQPGVFVRGEGIYLFDAEGRKYLDFLSGIAVNALGHCHPGMVAAIEKQAKTLIHCSNGLLTEPQVELAAKLHELTGMDRTFFANCGTTATETAIKIAKKYGQKHGKTDFIVLQQSFHGRTLGAVSATAQEKHQAPFRPLLGGFKAIPANDLSALREAVTDQTMAVMVEPIQGEGGLKTLTEAFLWEIRRLCDAHEALFIADEIQTGVGRTGKFLAVDHFDVKPDVVCLAKALGGGFPIGACLTRGFANDILNAGEHGSTFGGNALACATSLAVLEIIEKDNLVENAAMMGAVLESALAGLNGPIAEHRGKGLMRGVVLTKPVAREGVRKCLENGFIINATDDNTLRILPPLIVNEEHIEAGMKILQSVLNEYSD